MLACHELDASHKASVCALSYEYTTGTDGYSCECAFSDRRVCMFMAEGSTSKFIAALLTMEPLVKKPENKKSHSAKVVHVHIIK